ncbi:MAG: rRNA maturation RNase YbeY [Alphaproteobacteria bacterium]
MTTRIEIEVSLACARWRRAIADAPRLARRAAAAALAAASREGAQVPSAAELSLVLGDDALVRGLNRLYRRKDAATNVLSFPALTDAERARAARARKPARPALLGDVVVAFGTSRREAVALGKPLADHLAHLVVHGTLHLLGYDHALARDAARMERLEAAVLAGLGIADPYGTPRPEGRASRSSRGGVALHG